MDDAKTKVMQRAVAGARRAPPPPLAPQAPAGRRQAVAGRGPRAAASLLSFVHLRESAPCDGMRALPDAIFDRGVSNENGSWSLYVAIAVAVLLAIALIVVLILK